MTMTIRERMMAVYHGQMPDKTPVGIYTRYLSRGTVERKAREMGLGVIDYAPPVSMLAPPWHVLDGFLSAVQDSDFAISYKWQGGKRIERRALCMPEGTLYADVEQDEGGAGSEHIRKHYIETEEDYPLAIAAARRTVFSDNGKLFRKRVQALGEDGVVLGRLDRSPFQKCLLELCAQDAFLMDVYDELPQALELLEVLKQRQLEAAERVIASEAEVIWLPDNVTSDMTPPNLFETWCLPFYQQIAQWAKQAGKPLLAHFDGKVSALAPHIRRSGISAVESLSYPEMAGDLTPKAARDMFPGMLALPNFPANLSYESEEKIMDWVRAQKCELDDQPWMLQLSEDLPGSESDKVILAVSKAMNE